MGRKIILQNAKVIHRKVISNALHVFPNICLESDHEIWYI